MLAVFMQLKHFKNEDKDNLGKHIKPVLICSSFLLPCEEMFFHSSVQDYINSLNLRGFKHEQPVKGQATASEFISMSDHS